jgi:hypothetical protein
MRGRLSVSPGLNWTRPMISAEGDRSSRYPLAAAACEGRPPPSSTPGLERGDLFCGPRRRVSGYNRVSDEDRRWAGTRRVGDLPEAARPPSDETVRRNVGREAKDSQGLSLGNSATIGRDMGGVAGVLPCQREGTLRCVTTPNRDRSNPWGTTSPKKFSGQVYGRHPPL